MVLRGQLYRYFHLENNRLRLHIFVDQSSGEIFTNQGKIVFSLLTYPAASQVGIELFSQKGTATLSDFTGWQLNSIWNHAQEDKIQVPIK